MNNMALSNKATSIRKKLGVDRNSPIDIFALTQNIEKLTLVLYPLGENISGVCMRKKTSTLLAINSKMSVGRQRFSLAHELYHFYFDQEMTTIICPQKIGSKEVREQTADRFASYLLMPQTALYENIEAIKENGEGFLTLEDIVNLEQYYKVSRHALLYRLLKDKQLSPAEALEFKNNVILSAARLGYDVSLYKPLPKEDQKRTFGYYIKKAEELLENDKISNGKYEELLLDAFRDDIVFGKHLDNGAYID